MSSGRASQPVFMSRSVGRQPERAGISSRIRAGFQRAMRRKKEMAPVAGKVQSKSPAAVRKRAGRLLTPIFALALVVASGLVAYGPLARAVAGMKLFRIQEITVTGCRVTTPAKIRDLAGIRYQENMLTLNPSHVEAILKAHPWIAAVEVKRNWPDALVVAIQEYAAEALITQERSGGKQLFYLDKSGIAFAPVEPGHDMDFPVITGLDAKIEGQGDTKAVLQERLKEALAFLKLVRQNNPNLPAQNLSEIHVDPDMGMTVYLVDYSFPIYFGKGEIRTKYSRLKRVLEVLYKEDEQGMTIADVAYIRMDYQENKVLVARSGSG